MCQDALLFHGAFALLCNHPLVVPCGHPLLPAIAHRRVAKQEGDREGGGKQEEKWGGFGGPCQLHLVGHAWEDVSVIARLWRSVSLFEVRCFVEAEKVRGGNNVRHVWSCGSTRLASSKQREGAVIRHSTLQHGAMLARRPDLCMERAGGTQALFRKHVWFSICSSQFSERYYPWHKSIGHHGYSRTMCAR